MFAVDHAATALLIKRRFPSVSLTPLLLSVQAMELVWVGLNYLGIERTTTEASVRSVSDIHLAYMPFSHSVATAAGGALLAWLLVEKGLGRPAIARAIGIGIFSHLVLDVLTHAQDIVLWPGRTLPPLGLGLYDRAPMWGFALEIAYGVVCWSVYRGSRSLLAMIILGNLANVTLFSAAIPGPEQYLAGHPLMLVTLIAVQIVVTLVLINVLEAADHSYLEGRPGRVSEWELLPSEYFARQVYTTYWFESVAPTKLLGAIPVDRILFETDFPHPTCLYGNVHEKIETSLAGATEEQRRRILWENAAELYRVERPPEASP